MSSLITNERYLAFSLGAEEYAIPLLSVREVIAVPDITPVPQSPVHFLGIMNLRGQVISVIDLRTKFGIKPNKTDETSVIILDMGDHSLGAIVDSVNSVLSPTAEELSEPPDLEGNKNASAITKVFRREKSLVLILDILKTLSKEDKAAVLRSHAKAA
ncbi:MAG: chemotaxis protein CheW [Proteobacteria bacterium]|nr:chemotaxis protein CheW [Pseudomonadota bacterium]